MFLSVRSMRYNQFFLTLVYCFFLILWWMGACTAQTLQTPPSATASNTVKYKTNCTNPSNESEAEVCQEEYSNSIAEAQVSWTRDQTIVGALGICAVIFTLILSIKSTNAAVVGVAAANRSAKAAEESSYVERAWLIHDKFISVKQLHAVVNGVPGQDGITFEHIWFNGGRTPATNVRGVMLSKIIKSNEEFPIFDIKNISEDRYAALGTVGQNRQSASVRLFFSQEIWESVKSGTTKCVIYSHVEYLDVFQPFIKRTTEICGFIFQSGTHRDEYGKEAEKIVFSAKGPQNDCT